MLIWASLKNHLGFKLIFGLCNIVPKKYTYHPIIGFSDEDVEGILNMVFCACDEGNRDGVLSLDEFTSEVCEVQ